jgi:hypothetical protein
MKQTLRRVERGAATRYEFARCPRLPVASEIASLFKRLSAPFVQRGTRPLALSVSLRISDYTTGVRIAANTAHYHRDFMAN